MDFMEIIEFIDEMIQYYKHFVNKSYAPDYIRLLVTLIR